MTATYQALGWLADALGLVGPHRGANVASRMTALSPRRVMLSIPLNASMCSKHCAGRAPPFSVVKPIVIVNSGPHNHAHEGPGTAVCSR